MYEAYPLHWPVGYKRTLLHHVRKSRFKQTLGAAQKYLHKEVERIKGTDLVVSTNLRVRNDGMIYAADLGKNIEDPGVAIYFKRNKKLIAMCCDTYEKVWENMYALARGLEALRLLDRDGVSEFLERAFTGFKELPAAAQLDEKEIWKVLCFSKKPDSVDLVHAAYKTLAKERHPDTSTGSTEQFISLQNAYREALNLFN